jgi:type IV pilus assembly protein PilQ
MKRLICLLISVFCLLSFSLSHGLAYESDNFIKEVNVTSKANEFKIELIADSAISDYFPFTLTDPARLVIDMPLTEAKIPKTYSLDNLSYPLLRWGIFKGNLRVVIDTTIAEIPPYKITAKDNILEIIFPLEEPSISLIPIKAIDFEQISPKRCQLVVASEGELQYEIFRPELHRITLELNNVKPPSYHVINEIINNFYRELETKHFPCGIKRILPKVIDEKTVNVEIDLKERIPFKVDTTKQYLSLTFNIPAKEEIVKELPKEEIAKKPLPQREVEAPPPAEEVLPEEIQIIFPGQITKFKGRTIYLDFQEADLRHVFRILAEVSGLNFIVHENVEGSVTLKLGNVPWDQALDTLLQNYGLGVIKIGNVMRILPLSEMAKEQDQLIKMQQVLERREEFGPLFTEEIQVNYVRAEELLKQLEDIRTSRGRISFDELTNRIIMTDVRPRIEKAKRLIRSLDFAPKQILIEGRIVEVSVNYAWQLGIQWGVDTQSIVSKGRKGIDTISTHGETGEKGTDITIDSPIGELETEVPLAVNLPPTTTYGGFGISFAHIGKKVLLALDAKLKAMEEEGNAKILSVPKVITMDNQRAHISQGTEIPYHTLSEAGTYTQFEDAVLKLEVTPHVTPEGKIKLDILLTKDTPGTRLEGMDSLPIDTKELETSILVNNEETAVLGGILIEEETETRSRVPFFGEIPILGFLFRKKQISRDKSELIMFITPKLLFEREIAQR